MHYLLTGRDGKGLRDRDRTVPTGDPRTRNDLCLIGPHRLSKFEPPHVAQ